MYTRDHCNIPPLLHSRILNPVAIDFSAAYETSRSHLIAKAEHTGMLPKFDVDVGLENNKKGRVYLRRSYKENTSLIN